MSNGAKIKQAAVGSSLQDVCCKAWTVQVLRDAGGSLKGRGWMTKRTILRSSACLKSTLLSFQMMALNGASKYLPSPRAALLLLVLGEQVMDGWEKSTCAGA